MWHSIRFHPKSSESNCSSQIMLFILIVCAAMCIIHWVCISPFCIFLSRNLSRLDFYDSHLCTKAARAPQGYLKLNSHHHIAIEKANWVLGGDLLSALGPESLNSHFELCRSGSCRFLFQMNIFLKVPEIRLPNECDSATKTQSRSFDCRKWDPLWILNVKNQHCF